MKTGYYLLCIAVMALTTYIIRVTPMVIFRKKINNVFIKSFLYYVPYTVLAAMTFPAIFSSTGTYVSAVAGCITAVILAFFKRGLLIVALGAAAAVFVFQLMGF
ncbi:MAG: AzlD domain-containing protein [Butyrivibrio sp.]